MKRLKLFGFLGLLFAGFGLMWLASDFLSREQATLEPNEPLVSGAPPDPTDLAVPRPTMEEMERQLAGLPASPMDSYVKPETSRRERLQILGHLFAEYHSTFHEIPSGLQVEIFSVFRGVNDRKIAYVPDGHPALNERGLPVNPEGFPILAHVLSASQGIFELRDPGPDGVSYSEDDLVASFPPAQREEVEQLSLN